MDPIQALSEIAFWLERERAPVFKVQAFRRSSAALASLSERELAARARDGRLKAMKGIGGRSLEVVQQALAGGVPDYLQNLRDHAAAETFSDAGTALFAQLRGDLHTHSDWSDGTTSVQTMVQAAAALGRDYLALTDHSPNLTIANGLSADRLAAELDLVDQINIDQINAGDGGVRLLSGIEVDILDDGALDQQPELLDRLDVVVASLHSHLRADESTVTRRLLGAITDPRTNVIGHITGRLVEGGRGTRPQSQFDAQRVFAACAEHHVAVEINSRPERQDPPDDLVRLAIDAGCLFSIDSDAHAPGHLDFLRYGAERAAANAVPVHRIVTTWPVERLLEWSRAGR
ncbi:PHP domain-containing protein [uncultured Amnibacterium sp.]|uniref:PHP domain-containing protein n=1 Tax=uncultured Amnibacterium sp. TaxID=1631851 RepID=UPI0035CC55C9